MSPDHDSQLKKLMLLMNGAFLDLSLKVSPLKIESLACTIYHAMSGRYRIFHSIEHIFQVADGLKGTAAIAAIFHDVIYAQVDRRIHPRLAPILSELIPNEKNNELILPKFDTESYLKMSGALFGFKEGLLLTPQNGLNEFLSSIVAARLLSGVMTELQIAQVISGIEATIPFRSQKNKQDDPFIRCHLQLTALNDQLKLGAPPLEIDTTVKSNIQIANQDISSFYNSDFGAFIAGTWSLILENNPIFKNPIYTVLDYQRALLKISAFFYGLDQETVVHRWGNVPTESTFHGLTRQVSKNLFNTRIYLNLKLLEISILDAIAKRTGGDAPYFLMIGQHSEINSTASIERYLWKPDTLPATHLMNQEVYRVLKNGRKSKDSFDFNHSPIAAFLYENLSEIEMKDQLSTMENYHQNKINENEFLQSFRKELIQPIMNGAREISWSRAI